MKTSLATILKYFLGITGSVGVLFGVWKYLDTINDGVKDVKEMTEYNNIQINDVSNQLYHLQDTADDIQKQQIKQGNQLDNLTWIVRHRNNYTQEQLDELMDVMMKKRTVVVAPAEPEHSTTPIPRYRGEVEFIAIDTLN